MRLLYWIIFLTFILYETSTSQIRIGSKQRALSNSDVAFYLNSFSVIKNPGLKSNEKSASLDLFYSPSTFNFSELKNYALGIMLPKKTFNVGIIFTGYGFDLYKKSRIISNVAFDVLNNLTLGLNLEYSSLNIENYGNSNSFVLSMGFSYKLDNISLGFSANNLLKNKISQINETQPSLIDLGFSYSVSPELILLCAIEAENGFDENYKFGLLFNPFTFLEIMTGFQTYPESFSTGITVNYNKFEFTYSIFTHQYFPVTHQIGLTINSGIEL